MSVVRLLAAAAMALALSPPASAQSDDLGDTHTPPPSLEDLGVVTDASDAGAKPKKDADGKGAKKGGAKGAPGNKEAGKETGKEAGASDAATEAPAPKDGPPPTDTPPSTSTPPSTPRPTPSTPAGDAPKAAPKVHAAPRHVEQKAKPEPARPAPRAAPKVEEKKPAGPPPEIVQKAEKLEDEVNGLLAAEPGDAHALESVSTQWVDDKVLGARPDLRALLKLARARALTIQGRFDEAASALSDAKSLADGAPRRAQRRLTAQVRYRVAQLEEVRTPPAAACGALGLSRVATYEGREARDRLQRLAARYKAAVQTGDKFWGRRAAFKTAALYDDLYRAAVAPAQKNLRGVSLPRPFAVGSVDSRAVVSAVLGGAWPAEISRLYSEIIGSIDARAPDDILLAQVKKRSAAFARLKLPDGEKAENPWFKDETPGLVRFNGRFEKKNPDGSWSQLAPADAKEALKANLEKPLGTVDNAYALAALAETGPAPAPDKILAALAHKDDRVVLAGLLAAERAPTPALLEPLIAVATRPQKGEAFATLQASLFGLRERSLLALRALASKDRDVAAKILDDARLPARERAWIVAEVGDSRLERTLQGLASDRDPVVAATALYALTLADGRNFGYLRQSDNGVVGCVSRAIAAIDASRPH